MAQPTRDAKTDASLGQALGQCRAHSTRPSRHEISVNRFAYRPSLREPGLGKCAAVLSQLSIRPLRQIWHSGPTLEGPRFSRAQVSPPPSTTTISASVCLSSSRILHSASPSSALAVLPATPRHFAIFQHPSAPPLSPQHCPTVGDLAPAWRCLTRHSQHTSAPLGLADAAVCLHVVCRAICF